MLLVGKRASCWLAELSHQPRRCDLGFPMTPGRLRFTRQQGRGDGPASFVVSPSGGFFELIEGTLQDGLGNDVRDRFENARHTRWKLLFPAVEQFLEELFTRAKPDDLDPDVKVRLEAGEADHAR